MREISIIFVDHSSNRHFVAHSSPICRLHSSTLPSAVPLVSPARVLCFLPPPPPLSYCHVLPLVCAFVLRSGSLFLHARVPPSRSLVFAGYCCTVSRRLSDGGGYWVVAASVVVQVVEEVEANRFRSLYGSRRPLGRRCSY